MEGGSNRRAMSCTLLETMCVVGGEGWEVGEKGSASAPGGERRVGLARAPWSLAKSPSDDAGGSGRCGLGTLPPAHGADVSLLVWGWDARPL